MAEAEKELSLRDQIVAARDEVNSKQIEEPAGLEEPQAAEVKEPETVAAAEPEVKETTAPVRDASGRFVSSKQEKDGATTLGNQSQSVAPTTLPDIGVPNSWTAAEKALWDKIPREVKQIIERREGDAHRAITKQDEERAFAREFSRVTAPYEAQLRSMNVTPMQAYQSLLNATYILRSGTPQQKMEILLNAARDAGVDLRSAFHGQIQQNQPPAQGYAQLPPQLVEELQASRKWREQIAAERQQAETEAYNQQVAAIEEFRANPANPHFDAVRETMVSLIQSGQAKGLQDAYEMATWANPSIRSQLQAASAAPAANVQVQRQKVAQAKQKGVSIKGGPGNAPDAARGPAKTLRQELETAFREASGRV